jgi:hypothetical protein
MSQIDGCRATQGMKRQCMGKYNEFVQFVETAGKGYFDGKIKVNRKKSLITSLSEFLTTGSI